MIEEITYKDKIYKVLNPGSLMLTDRKSIINQLSTGDSILPPRHSDLSGLLMSEYGITQEDYYIIVVERGIPKPHVCAFCGKPLGFISLKAGYGSSTARTCGYKCAAKLRIRNRNLGEWAPDNYDVIPGYNSLPIKEVEGFLVHGPGTIVKVSPRSKRHVDQLSSDGRIYLSRRRFCRAIMKNYGLSEMEYFSLVVHGDRSFRPNCSCGNPVEFAGSHIGFRKFCGDECRTKWRISFDRRKFLKFCSDSGVTTARMYCGVVKFDKEVLKIGITTKHITERASIAKIYSPHLLVEGDPEYIADLEQKIKEKFSDKLIRRGKNLRESYSIELLHEILSYLRSLK